MSDTDTTLAPVEDSPNLELDSSSVTHDAEPTLGAITKRRRTAKIDPVLAEAKELARSGVLEITTEKAIGLVHHLRGEEERLTTHLFECTLPGYRGWFWFATLSRAPRSKQATICEVGLIPGDDALLAPEWIPWSERLKNIAAEELEAFDAGDELDEVIDVEDDAALPDLATEEFDGEEDEGIEEDSIAE